VEEYHEQEFGAEYRKQQPEDPYREQELPKGFEDGKSNSFFDAYFILRFLQTQPISLIYKLHCFSTETWLDSHPLIVMTNP
jgi:hypothetical protein